jgi:hypothetical protein
MPSRPSPPEQLRERLAFQRARGAAFDHAWTRSVSALHWRNGDDRHEWIPALEATRDEWRAAYEHREPDVTLRAVGGLQALLAA